jgi:CDP-diacylglycerol--glycerol-3-phosphate 3-phosphatidyltransferase/cardiolipin synthase
MSISTQDSDARSNWNLPNTLTWLRILMIPAILVLFYLPYWWKDPAACAAFALAGITDSLDGYYARKRGQTSRLGAFLDPVADKLIVAAALVLIVSADPKSSFLVIIAIVIIGREIAVSALREWMAEIGARGRIKVSVWGKSKTIMQIVGLSFLLFRHDILGIPVYKLGLVLTGIAALLTLWSMFLYLRAAWPELRGSAKL